MVPYIRLFIMCDLCYARERLRPKRSMYLDR